LFYLSRHCLTSLLHTAFVIEAVADQQKAASKADPATKDLWTETGLWRYCRQPNYFGEMAGYGFLRGSFFLFFFSHLFSPRDET
jgi:steroid 5-alpha reductase family enzyme